MASLSTRVTALKLTWPPCANTALRRFIARALRRYENCLDCLKQLCDTNQATALDFSLFSWYKMNEVHSLGGEMMTEATQEGIQSKRQAIIEAALDIFAKQGYEDTTIAQIAAAAGVAVGTVYLYFHNKREIYTQVSVNWTERLAVALQDPHIL